MRSKVTLGKFAVYCLLLSALTYIITSSFSGYLAFKRNGFYAMGVAAAVNVILYVIYTYPIIGASMGLLTPVSAAAYYFVSKDAFRSYVRGIWDTAYGTFTWFMEYLYKPIEVDDHYSKIIITIIVIVVTFTYFVLVIYKRYTVLAIVCGICVISVMWITKYGEAFDYMKQYMFLSLLLYGFSNYDLSENKWRLRRDDYSRKISLVWALCTLAVLIAASAGAAYLPGQIKPLNKKWVEGGRFTEAWNNWRQGEGEDLKGEDKFNLNSVGFQREPSKLGGSVKASNILMMKVKAEGKVKSPIYLRGTVKDLYTGSMWIKSSSKPVEVEDKDEITGLWGDNRKVEKHQRVSITVYPQAIKTASLFNLWMPKSVDSGGAEYHWDSEGDIYTEDLTARAREYTVVSDVPIVNSDELRSASAKAGPGLDKYLQLPENLPDRVKSLALKITDKYGNHYDKAIAIQDYLRETYPYTLETSVVPYGSDFVDHFLFDEKKGYCTYFASAMAVLSRAAGIPSRYVEGMMADNKDRDEQGLYSVMSSSAHAWVEIYFDGYGWVRFEPTPSYERASYVRTSEVEDPQQGDITKPLNGINSPENIKGAPQNNPAPAQRESRYFIFLYVLGAIILAVILKVAAKIYIYKRRFKKAEELKDKDAAMEYLNLLEAELKKGGIVRAHDETPSEFGSRVHEILLVYNMDIKRAMNTFDSIRFGKGKMDVNAREMFRQVIAGVENFVKDKKGVIKYLMFKYII